MADVLTVLIEELRAAQPVEESQFMEWLESIGQVIRAFPTEIRRGACIILIGNDICVRTGLPLDVCVQAVYREVKQARGVAR